jgi:hypothetical protein
MPYGVLVFTKERDELTLEDEELIRKYLPRVPNVPNHPCLPRSIFAELATIWIEDDWLRENICTEEEIINLTCFVIITGFKNKDFIRFCRKLMRHAKYRGPQDSWEKWKPNVKTHVEHIRFNDEEYTKLVSDAKRLHIKIEDLIKKRALRLIHF